MLLFAALSVTAMSGCRSSGSHWPNMAWWGSHKQDADAASIAASKSPDLPQLPSASATPTPPSSLVAKTSPTSKPPSNSTINAGGTLPDSSGAVPASYPTTPYPAVAPIQAVGQAAIQAPTEQTPAPATGGAPPIGGAATAPVQTEPYSAGVNSQPGPSSQVAPHETPGTTPTAANQRPYSATAPAYRTADTRPTAPALTAANPDVSPSYGANDVGNRYATPATSSTPDATPAPQDATSSLGNAPAAATPPMGTAESGNRYGAVSGDRYATDGTAAYGSLPGSNPTPQQHPSHPSAAPGAVNGNPLGAPHASGINPAAGPTTDPNPPAAIAIPVSSPSATARTDAATAKPARFRPGGTSDYHSPLSTASPSTRAVGTGMPAATSPPAIGTPAAASRYPTPPTTPAYWPPQTDSPATGYPPTGATGYPQTGATPGLPPTLHTTTPPPGETRAGAPIAPSASSYPSFGAPYNPGSAAGSGTRN